MKTYANQLLQTFEIVAGRLWRFVGAGVSMSAIEHKTLASWSGLLENGLEAWWLIPLDD
ncbi:MAG: hypothetical protein JOZ08_16205 [Verrucomicrobia bacterium]|nr:hypothetical protein [Verrucomicrobiota bacterium]MBV8279577.1 hypothetical protein [Verrucomicrobiota bacterium]